MPTQNSLGLSVCHVYASIHHEQKKNTSCGVRHMSGHLLLCLTTKSWTNQPSHGVFSVNVEDGVGMFINLIIFFFFANWTSVQLTNALDTKFVCNWVLFDL